jgi:hypothetical protein
VELIALLRAGDIMVMDEATTAQILLAGSLSSVQLVEVLWQRGRRHRLRDAITMVLEALGNASEEKHRQDRGVLPVN